MKKVSFLIALIVMSISCTKQPLSIGLDKTNLDTTVNPADNFYQYACGGWMVKNPLPGEYSRFGSFDQLGLNNLERVNGLIKELSSKKNEVGSVEQKIADIYNLAMDTARRDTEGITPVKSTLDEIANLKDGKDVITFLGKSLDCSLWGMYVGPDAMNADMNILNEGQAGFALGNKDYYFDKDDRSKMIREEYVKHIARMFTLFGYEDGETLAKTVMRMETRLAKAAKSETELRDPIANYNKMSVSDLKKLVPQVDWDLYTQGWGIVTDSLSVGQIDHLKEAGKMLADEKLEDLKTLFAWQVIDGATGALTTEIYDANFDFAGRIFSGREEQTPLWKRAVGVVNGSLGEAMGQAYVKKYFPAEDKERMLKLVHNLQDAFAERIKNVEWMSDETKVKALDKLSAFTIKIGYPDKWRDYTALTIDPSKTYYENLQEITRFEVKYELSFLDKPVDKARWYMNAHTVNAYYNPSSNEICFPAGILQPPFFDMSADDAFNYGAIGVVIGHEMTHGFDDQGCQFDKFGNLNNWWTAEDKKQFDARTKVLEEYFNHIEVAPGLFANGALTLGENIADHGGLQIAFQAFKNSEQSKPEAERLTTKEGFTPEQRFFLAYANVWANNIRPEEIANRVKSDPHSLGEWRVNGTLPHIVGWIDAFGVKEGDALYVSPENRVHIW